MSETNCYNVGERIAYNLFAALEPAALADLSRALNTMNLDGDDEAEEMVGGMLDALGDSNSAYISFTGNHKF